MAILPISRGYLRSDCIWQAFTRKASGPSKPLAPKSLGPRDTKDSWEGFHQGFPPWFPTIAVDLQGWKPAWFPMWNIHQPAVFHMGTSAIVDVPKAIEHIFSEKTTLFSMMKTWDFTLFHRKQRWRFDCHKGCQLVVYIWWEWCDCQPYLVAKLSLYKVS